MASPRLFTRLARSTPAVSATARASARSLPRQAFRQQSRRGYADGGAPKKGGNGGLFAILGLAAVGGGGYYYYTQNAGEVKAAVKKYGPDFKPEHHDYQDVYNAIAAKLHSETDYDDGSYGPVLLRLGWHASGTYDVKTGTGGSNGATMRFAPEGDHGANAGLKAARDFLEPIKAVTSIQEMQGPVIPWRPGRSDRDASWCTPDGRLPDASKDQKHLRAIFGRMGFNDQEIVALSGAHALGRCHTDRSGFEGPWTFSPTVVTNDYFKLLLEEKWGWRKWDGPKQYADATTKTLMMLPTDYSLVQDKSFKKHVERYAKDNEVFFKEFSDVLLKLFELGVPFQSSEDSRYKFKTTA